MEEDRFVRLVSALGPRNLAKISHRLRVSRETAARAYEKITEEGLGPRPNINFDKLGLRRHVAIAKADPKADPRRLSSTFSLMGDYAYLEQYQKLDPSNMYLMIMAIPPELSNNVTDFLAELGRTSLLKVLGPTPLAWMRYHPLRAPWNHLPSEPILSGPLSYIPGPAKGTRRATFEFKELLLLAALQAYPSESLLGLLQVVGKWADAGYEEIKGQLSTSPSEWYPHLRRALRFIDSYPVHLSRGKPGVVRRRRHMWAQFTAMWKGLSQEEIRRAAMASTAIPYLRTDGASPVGGLYFSITAAPSHLVPGYLRFLSQNGPKNMSIGILSRYGNYSLPFASFVPEEGRWGWKKERLEALLATLQTA